MTDRATAATPGTEQPIVTAVEGVGPLLQRDYWAVIEGCCETPEQVMRMIRAAFPRFAPSNLVRFSPKPTASADLSEGDQMEVDIQGSGACHVQIVHRDERSLTLRTLEDHPEAGRITFTAARTAGNRLLLGIRSRARANGLLSYIGYILFGKAMQTKTWVTFIERVAIACGGYLVGNVRVATSKVTDSPHDAHPTPAPTFRRLPTS